MVIFSVFELLAIDGFNKEIVQKLIPFITIQLTTDEPLKTSLKNPDIHEIILRYQTTLEEKKGYTPPDTSFSGQLTSRYAGDPNRLYARYLYAKPGKYSFGMTVEKDPGEEITWDPPTLRYGTDYYSFHAMIENRGVLKKIIIGDFNLDYGQGLIFGSGIRIGKGTEPVLTIRKNNLGLRPYRSVYENKDYSGIAISVGRRPLELNVFYSLVKRDAIPKDDTTDVRDQYISYIQTIGLHRTPTEIFAKHRLSDETIGVNVNLKTKNTRFEIGLNGLYTRYNIPISPSLKKYNQFEFVGLTNKLGGFYLNYFFKNAHVFGEMAVSESGGMAISSGIIANLSSQVQASFHYRKYDKDFHSFYGEPFRENTKIGNEQGFYWGLRITPISNLQIRTYLDIYKFPWLKYQVDAPSQGWDFMASGIYTVNQKLNFRIQYRTKTKEVNFIDQEEPLRQILPEKTERWFFHMLYRLNAIISAQSRIQHSTKDFHNNKNTGFMLAQDLVVTKLRYAISARFSLFDTDDYDTRQFIYERDLLYVYSIPAFYNKGVRYYLLTKYLISEKVTLWLKFAQTKYVGLDAIGSGLEEIKGDTKTDINVQIRLKI